MASMLLRWCDRLVLPLVVVGSRTGTLEGRMDPKGCTVLFVVFGLWGWNGRQSKPLSIVVDNQSFFTSVIFPLAFQQNNPKNNEYTDDTIWWEMFPNDLSYFNGTNQLTIGPNPTLVLTSYLVSHDTLHTSCALFCFCHWEENSRKMDSFGRGYSVFRSLYERELMGNFGIF